MDLLTDFPKARENASVAANRATSYRNISNSRKISLPNVVVKSIHFLRQDQRHGELRTILRIDSNFVDSSENLTLRRISSII